MRTLTSYVFVLAVLAVLGVGGVLYLTKPPQVEVLDETYADYLEDEQTNRILAGIQVQLRRTGDETRVHLTASAEAPNVDQVPGYRGLRGANHITARELERTLTSGQLRIVTQLADSRTKHLGTCRPGRRGHIPERRVDEDGKLLLHALSKRDYLLEVHCRSVPLPDGEHDTYVEVKGVPRLRVQTVVREGTGRIVSVESLGGHNLRQ